MRGGFLFDNKKREASRPLFLYANSSIFSSSKSFTI